MDILERSIYDIGEDLMDFWKDDLIAAPLPHSSSSFNGVARQNGIQDEDYPGSHRNVMNPGQFLMGGADANIPTANTGFFGDVLEGSGREATGGRRHSHPDSAPASTMGLFPPHLDQNIVVGATYSLLQQQQQPPPRAWTTASDDSVPESHVDMSSDDSSSNNNHPLPALPPPQLIAVSGGAGHALPSLQMVQREAMESPNKTKSSPQVSKAQVCQPRILLTTTAAPATVKTRLVVPATSMSFKVTPAIKTSSPAVQRQQQQQHVKPAIIAFRANQEPVGNARQSSSSSNRSSSSSNNVQTHLDSGDESRPYPSYEASQRRPPQTRHRNKIKTPLISTQPKGATGMLYLTEEEKRTLISEGYPVPQRLPLTKAEEKSLKKIRRKIKNKISAQESRRKKKEYMDRLEQRMDRLADDVNAYKRKCSNLESHNASLVQHIRSLKGQLTRMNGGGVENAAAQ